MDTAFQAYDATEPDYEEHLRAHVEFLKTAWKTKSEAAYDRELQNGKVLFYLMVGLTTIFTAKISLGVGTFITKQVQKKLCKKELL